MDVTIKDREVNRTVCYDNIVSITEKRGCLLLKDNDGYYISISQKRKEDIFEIKIEGAEV